jgi:MFS family permease
MADIFSKKYMLFYGMLLQALVIISIPVVSSFYPLILLSALLGIGTALVYPTFLTSIAQITTPVQRAESIGTFRLWRDLGYAFGALLSGVVADFFGINYAIIFIGLITVISSIILLLRLT